MKNAQILINRYHNEENFGEPVEVFEYVLDVNGKPRVANMTFIMRAGCKASVAGSFGTITGMAHLTKDFIKEHLPNQVINQVLSDSEAKAMHKAGLRLWDGDRAKSLNDTLDARHNQRNGGISMRLHNN